MTVRATVAEFNPFHNGHKYLVDRMKDGGAAAVTVMSGNYVQRGGCAVYDKFTRAAAAVRGGVDLVIELPLIYSLSSAEHFALGSVETLDALGLVDELWFGSEAGETAVLEEIAAALTDESDGFRAELSRRLSEGESFAAARQKALEMELGEKAAALSLPNNILAVEYLKALRRTGSKILPVTIPRTGAAHDSDESGDRIASAKALRDKLRAGESIMNFVPFTEDSEPVFDEDFAPLISYRLKVASTEELEALPDCNREIAARLKKAASANSLDAIIAAAHSRRYADSRLRRILFNLTLNNTCKYSSPAYLRVLAFSRRGAEILRRAAKTATLPLISRGGAVKDSEIFKAECRGTDVYSLITGQPSGREFTFRPYMYKNEEEII